METTANKNIATLLHLSALTQYFFPLGNLIFPALLWSLKKNESEFVDYNGKQAVNFQLSLFLYMFILVVIAAPIFIYTLVRDINFNVISTHEYFIQDFSIGKITWLVMIAIIAVFLVIGLKIAEFVCILYASVKSNKGEKYNYPLTINFIR